MQESRNRAERDTQKGGALHNGPGENWKPLFDRASKEKPWTLGYQSLNEEVLEAFRLPIEGRIPAALRGVLYRNGPSRHERGGMRYHHRWDGDGMVHAYKFADDGVSHRGRYVRTEKYVAEEKAGHLLLGSFGTVIPGADPFPSDIDSMNAANINALPFAGELLALWEPGSAYSMNLDTLETIGVKTWSPNLAGMPFSGHAKVECDGSLWNFGVNPVDGILMLYHISPIGELLKAHALNIDQLPPMHDFAVTERHLVFLFAPLMLNLERLRSGMCFAESCEWKPELGMRVLVVAKSDFSKRWCQLPPGCLFHVGNAWEDSNGAIKLTYMRAEDPRSLLAGWSIMRGEYRHKPGSQITLLTLDPTTGKATQESIPGEGEFPRVDPRVVGRRYRHLVSLSRNAGRSASVVGFDEVRRFDIENGEEDIYHYGSDWLLDEHIVIPDPADETEGTGWVVGTALDLRGKSTVLSVFNAKSLRDGPIAQVRLPYALPIGLHGNFSAA